MKKKIIRTAILFLIATLHIKATFAEYTQISVTPIFWKKDGTPFILLVKENNPIQGLVWSNLYGPKEEVDNDDRIKTAKRVVSNASAHQLVLSGDFYHYQDENSSTVYLIWKTEYIDPRDILNSVNMNWCWVKLQDLLEGKINLQLDESFANKLVHPAIKDHLWSLLTNEISSQ